MNDHNCSDNLTIIKSGKLLNGCSNCLFVKVQKGNAAAFNRRHMKAQHRKDLVQRNMGRDYAKAYPKEAREYYGDDMFRELC